MVSPLHVCPSVSRQAGVGVYVRDKQQVVSATKSIYIPGSLRLHVGHVGDFPIEVVVIKVGVFAVGSRYLPPQPQCEGSSLRPDGPPVQ